MATYRVVRFHERDDRRKVIMRGLTEKQAQWHCKSPQSNSRTATSKKVLGYALEFGPWYDAYEAEEGE